MTWVSSNAEQQSSPALLPNAGPVEKAGNPLLLVSTDSDAEVAENQVSKSCENLAVLQDSLPGPDDDSSRRIPLLMDLRT